jgi:redox-sensing transcriptional repressor
MRGLNLIKYNKKNIPQPTIHRLSICHRCLELFIETEKGNARETISSSEISKITGINSNQIRKDLAYFGKFGRRGIGYPIKDLIYTLKYILGSSKKWDIIIVGAGSLGEALLRYQGFQKRGFRIKAVFDSDISKIGKTINDNKILNVKYMENYIKKRNIKVGIITVPVASAQEVVDCMVAGGVKSILNFAPITLKYPHYVKVNTIDISVELERLVYFLSSEPRFTD